MPETPQSAAHPQPLTGVRVLDLTRVLAGPYCTMILADLGAQVVKIERPETGDDARQFGPFLPSGLSAYFASINRGKQSVALDLKRADDRETFLKLVAHADVVVENFRPGTMAAFGLSAAELQQRNPRLIYAALSGFGQTGRESNRPAYDVIVQALSGLMSVTGDGPGHSVRVGTSIGDILTGLYGAIAVVAALGHRDRTGEGTGIDLAMLDCTVSAMENAIARYSVTGEVPQPMGTRHPSITPFQAFTASDGPVVVAAGNDNLWRKLCVVAGCAELADDPLFANNHARTENRDLLEQRLNPLFAQRTRDVWLEILSQAGIPTAPIRDTSQVAADPHLAERGMLHEMVDADGQRFLTVGSPLRMNGSAAPISDRAPQLGEHTQQVLREWLGR